jgi:hypothetical protein
MATQLNTVLDLGGQIADRLGDIKAQIAELKAIEANLIGILVNGGEGAFDGNLFRATVSSVAERKSLDAKAAEAKLRELGVDGRWFAKNQKVAKGYTVVKVVARKA